MFSALCSSSAKNIPAFTLCLPYRCVPLIDVVDRLGDTFINFLYFSNKFCTSYFTMHFKMFMLSILLSTPAIYVLSCPYFLGSCNYTRIYGAYFTNREIDFSTLKSHYLYFLFWFHRHQKNSGSSSLPFSREEKSLNVQVGCVFCVHAC